MKYKPMVGMKDSVFSIQEQGKDPEYKIFNELPPDIKDFLMSDERVKSVRKYSNGDIVASHNYKKNRQLFDLGVDVVLYVSHFSYGWVTISPGDMYKVTGRDIIYRVTEFECNDKCFDSIALALEESSKSGMDVYVIPDIGCGVHRLGRIASLIPATSTDNQP